MNIQDEMQKIHHKFGVSEMANYKIEQFIENLIKEDRAKQLTLTDVVERLPVGEVIKLIDSEDFKGYTGELKITGHCSYMDENVGYLVNGEGIFLIEDFVR
tara:strand:+ start:2031 stop:2333 length:303 start_codon:yes stop_codon:yes gene_type:complete